MTTTIREINRTSLSQVEKLVIEQALDYYNRIESIKKEIIEEVMGFHQHASIKKIGELSDELRALNNHSLYNNAKKRVWDNCSIATLTMIAKGEPFETTFISYSSVNIPKEIVGLPYEYKKPTTGEDRTQVAKLFGIRVIV